MSLLTIVEASKQVKVGRTTIYKAIKRGDLTPQKNHDGIQVIDAQDMIRVFGSSKKSVSPPYFRKQYSTCFWKQRKQRGFIERITRTS